MKVLRINEFFKKVGQAQVKYRWVLLAIMFCFTVFGLAGLHRLKIEDQQENWFSDKETLKIATDRYEEIFGNEDVITVLVKSKNVFDSDVLCYQTAMNNVH